MNLQHETLYKSELKGHILQVADPDQGSLASEHSAEDLAFYQGFQPTSSPAKKDVAESRRVAKAIRAQIKPSCVAMTRAPAEGVGEPTGLTEEVWQLLPIVFSRS